MKVLTPGKRQVIAVFDTKYTHYSANDRYVTLKIQVRLKIDGHDYTNQSMHEIGLDLRDLVFTAQADGLHNGFYGFQPVYIQAGGEMDLGSLESRVKTLRKISKKISKVETAMGGHAEALSDLQRVIAFLSAIDASILSFHDPSDPGANQYGTVWHANAPTHHWRLRRMLLDSVKERFAETGADNAH